MTVESLARPAKSGARQRPAPAARSQQTPNARQTVRRRQILQATLRLVRREGTGVTTAQIAAESRCSKETLYAWFGSREGIFAALVEAQAEAMAEALAAGFAKAEGTLENRIRHNATVLLDIMTGDAVLVVNRIAMSQATAHAAPLGERVLAGWREAVAKPFHALFEEGNAAGTLTVYDTREAFDTLAGLLVGDRQRQLLLGAAERPGAKGMASIASKAVQRWLLLYRA